MITLYTLEVFGSVVCRGFLKILPLVYVMGERTCVSLGVVVILPGNITRPYSVCICFDIIERGVRRGSREGGVHTTEGERKKF